jgi:8-oxo-dGTP pyrophosphatase MutT (NUDIX family)
VQKSATVAVINNEQKLLLLRRGPTAPWMPGRYCLPGGKIEKNEDATYAASRELSEETGISYPVDELRAVTISYSSGYNKTVWVAVVNSDKVILNWEHDDYVWVSPSESSTIDLVPGLRTTIKTLVDGGHLI